MDSPLERNAGAKWRGGDRMGRLVAGDSLDCDKRQACPRLQGNVARCFDHVKPTSGGVDRRQNAADPAVALGDEEAGTPVPPGDRVRGISQQDPHEVGVTLAPEYHQIGAVLVGIPADLNTRETICDAQPNLIDSRCPKYVSFKPATQMLQLRIFCGNSSPAGSFGHTGESGWGIHRDNPENTELSRALGSELNGSKHGLTAGIRFIGRSDDPTPEHLHLS
jgi:hypothetical protein